MLVAFAGGQLWKSEGNKLVIEGDGFSNSLTQYDDFKSGDLFYDADDLEPFGFKLDRFDATYERTGPSRGTPRTYRAARRLLPGADGKRPERHRGQPRRWRSAATRSTCCRHGYSPVVTVKDGQGKIVFHGAAAFLPASTPTSPRPV